MKTLAARLSSVAVGACAIASVSGCLSVQRAAHVEVQVTDNQVVLLKPTTGLQRGGETVLKIDNYAQRPVNMVLAETTAPANRPPKALVDAISARDDSRIVGITSQIDKVGVQYAYGAIPSPSPRIATLHVYLEPGKRYLLFDKLDGGYAHGVSIALVPPHKK